MNTKERNYFLDIVKCVLAIFVILLHFDWKNGENTSFIFRFLINFTVPIFVFISGYLYAGSFMRNGIETLSQAYEFRFILAKILRILIPFTIAFTVEYILFRITGLFTVNLFEYGLLAFAFDFLRGGYGQGSYYFPIFIQFIFIFPLIYFVIKKHRRKGLIFIFVANVFYEILKSAFYMNDIEYRLLFFRYIFVAAAGCYAYLCEKNKKLEKKDIVIYICEFITGIFFICLFSYTNYTPKILVYWSSTSLVTCLYIIPMMRLLVLISNIKVRLYPLELIGKASYNIFLVQMIYYCIFASDVTHMIGNYVLSIVVNIIICVSTGIIFYIIENMITSRMVKAIKIR